MHTCLHASMYGGAVGCGVPAEAISLPISGISGCRDREGLLDRERGFRLGEEDRLRSFPLA